MGTNKEIPDHFERLNTSNDVGIDRRPDGTRVVVPTTPVAPVAANPILSRVCLGVSE